MNANELADELEAFHVDPDGFPYMIGEAITMLRQQADEIEHGIKLVKKFQDERDELQIECDRLYRIIELNGTLK